MLPVSGYRGTPNHKLQIPKTQITTLNILSSNDPLPDFPTSDLNIKLQISDLNIPTGNDPLPDFRTSGLQA